MQSKSTRGVQQEEVWAAADALIAGGERPTIERVRLKIGRGSPNTVSPMLEAWFATLAPRLGIAASGVQAEDQGTPKELRQALDGVWTAAVAAAREKADRTLSSERYNLGQQGLELEAARQDLSRREAALAERRIALEQALQLAKSQLLDQATQLEKTGRELERARSSIATLVQERDADRRQFDEQLRSLAEERQRIEQRTSANERRLLEEVDRARQEAKQSARLLEETKQRLSSEKEVIEQMNVTLGGRAHDGQLEIAALRERLKSMEEHAERLETTLAAAVAEPRRAEELGRRLVEQDAAVEQLGTLNKELLTKVDELLTAKQQLEVALATARSSVTAQERVVASMLERFSVPAPDSELAAKSPPKGANQSTKRDSKKSTETGT